MPLFYEGDGPHPIEFDCTPFPAESPSPIPLPTLQPLPIAEFDLNVPGAN